MLERTCVLAERFATGLRAAGYHILNEVVANQVLVSFGDAEMTQRVPADVPVTFDRIDIDLERISVRGVTDSSKQIDTIASALKGHRCFKEVKEGKVEKTRDGKQLDATRTKGTGSRAGTTYLGIYSLEGNTLKWCVGNPPGRTRPGELQSKTGQFLMVLTKEK